MKTFLILTLSLSVSLSAFSQDLPDSGFTHKAEAKNQLVHGVRQGKWIVYKDSDEKMTTDTTAPYYALMIFKSGVAYGIVRQYYNKSGKLLSEGRENGIEKWYYEDGKLQAEVPYVNSHKNGMEKWYYESGKLQYETPNVNDKTEGVKKEYYENGALKAECPYSNDKEEGIEKDYYEDGKLKAVYPFKKGVENGMEREYYESGNVKNETLYKNGNAGNTTNYADM
jgi:antitoxin component YwqK of YwqJK toxin-antitoxin module